ncbi:MAG: hypothetical protein COA82_11520, partial [Alkaliphilus sp.]
MGNVNSYVASIEEVEVFLRELKHILSSKNCELDVLPKKKEEHEDDPYTTANTMIDLSYDLSDVKNELLSLKGRDYIETVKDNRLGLRAPFWVFGNNSNTKQKDIYIKVKIRNKKSNRVFCVSFHYARFS